MIWNDFGMWAHVGAQSLAPLQKRNNFGMTANDDDANDREAKIAWMK